MESTGTDAPLSSAFGRTTISSPNDGPMPRGRVELNAVLALGAILNKEDWYIKWQTRPEVRAKWLAEVEKSLVAHNIAQVLACWPSLSSWYFGSIDKLVDMEHSGERETKIQELLARGLYPVSTEDDDDTDLGPYSDEDASLWSVSSDEAEVDEALAEGEDDSGDEMVLDQDDQLVPYAEAVAQAQALMQWSADGAPSSDDAVDSASDGETEESEHGILLRRHTKKNPFIQLAWYVNMVQLRTALRAIPPAMWSRKTISPVLRRAHRLKGDSFVISKTKELILVALASTRDCVSDAEGSRRNVTIEEISAWVDEPEQEQVLELLALHLQRIQDDLESLKEHLCRVLRVVIERLCLAVDSDISLGPSGAAPFSYSLPNMPGNPVILPGPVPQTWMTNALLPTFSRLKARFDAEVDALANVPDDMKDWHPNTNQQVLDLVHPSLHCCAFGVTKRVAADDPVATTTYATPAEQMRSVMFASATEPTRAATTTTRGDISFQWLPAEVSVSSTDSAAFLTYINNLHPESHAELYNTLGEVFAQFVPLFERVLSTLGQDHASTPLANAGDATTLCPPQLVPPGLFYDETMPSRAVLRGKTCQVIVKIAEIRLTPENPEYPGGSWHVEGTEEERIIATGLYYAACENITESRLSFRVMVQEPNDEESTSVSTGLEYGLIQSDGLVQSLGSVTAVEGRGVVFPNIFQHKVERFRLVDRRKPGLRRLLAFFLVDPSTPVLSTAVIPPQQQHWIERGLQDQLKAFQLPRDVKQRAHQLANVGWSVQEAHERRLELMAERSPSALSTSHALQFSLCEH
ncbi:hypothetical protein ATCC90586_007917 [Pythium insidiosum]|nr:hypothetical protein ATCC90586_007917 [Pythium insidiosum]